MKEEIYPARLEIRLTYEQLERLMKDAKKVHKTVSQFLRDLIDSK